MKLYRYVSEGRYEPVMEIPDNATNGDWIRALHGEPARISEKGVLYKFKYRNGKPYFSTFYDYDWWNSPCGKDINALEDALLEITADKAILEEENRLFKEFVATVPEVWAQFQDDLKKRAEQSEEEREM